MEKHGIFFYIVAPYFKSCHRSDPNIDQCAIQHGNEAIPTLVKGDRKYGIPVLAPLVLPSVVLSTDENFKINMRDIHINNLETAEVKDYQTSTDLVLGIVH
ncbi:hypothetical protein NQ318_009806 [Aromia moschata]|uniref:Uncharacterized protein n=1 Tax=Aromia moschata TaxID=1265417 RepID=A0AAV8XL22_9CUCU|nr:hypothetical protein NQ318_009806 [Aromia moschata]